MEALPIVLVPGLLASARLYGPQLPRLWQSAPLMIADPLHDDSMSAIAGRILRAAPPRFALVGLSMGGYISFEILRQAPGRVARVALLSTHARPDLPEQAAMRRAHIELAQAGRLAQVVDALLPRLVHRDRLEDVALRELVHQMAREVGVQAFVRQQRAIMSRSDSRPTLGSIRCPTLVLVGDADQVAPPERAAEMAEAIPGARRVVLAACGHLSTLEQPEAVTQALLEWLGSPA